MMAERIELATKPWNRIGVVTNRLPYSIVENGNGIEAKPSNGGLVTAMTPVVGRDGAGLWIGWPGTDDKGGLEEALRTASSGKNYQIAQVELDAAQIEGYYNGYSNQVLWPGVHGQSEYVKYNLNFWEQYKNVNHRFAQVAMRELNEGDFVWVHDYHLMLVAQEMRKAGSHHNIGFFLHTPFPNPHYLDDIPQREEIIEGLLSYNLVGFQSPSDMNNFIRNVQKHMENTTIEDTPNGITIGHREHKTVVGVFPISIDPHEFRRVADMPQTIQRAKAIAGELDGKHLFLTVARLDLTKGIPEGMEALALLLENNPALQDKVHLKQLVIPSREGIPITQKLKDRIDALDKEINDRYPSKPVETIHGTWGREELIANYMVADTGLIIPHADGQNLIPWEMGAVNTTRGNFILSKYAGAAYMLGEHGLLVDPRDTEAVARAMLDAYTMDRSERIARFYDWQTTIYANTVFNWADKFESAAMGICFKNRIVIKNTAPANQLKELV